MKLNFFFYFMQYAIIEAQKALTKGEIPIGCIIVNEKNKIIAKQHNLTEQNNNTNCHAEILCINSACKLLKTKYLHNCSLYTTLEPCIMCTYAISNVKLKRLFYATENIIQGAIESKINFFITYKNIHIPEIYKGIMQIQSKNILTNFFHKIRKKN